MPGHPAPRTHGTENMLKHAPTLSRADQHYPKDLRNLPVCSRCPPAAWLSRERQCAPGGRSRTGPAGQPSRCSYCRGEERAGRGKCRIAASILGQMDTARPCLVCRTLPRPTAGQNLKPASQKSSVTIQDQECRRHQPNYHLFALTTIKTKPKDDFSYSLPGGHLVSPPAILAPPSIQKAACWGHSELQRGKEQTRSPLLYAAHLYQILPSRTHQPCGPPTLKLTWGHLLWSQCLKTAGSAEGS